MRLLPDTINSSKDRDIASSAKTESLKAFTPHPAQQQQSPFAASLPSNLSKNLWLRPASAKAKSGEGTPSISRLPDPSMEKRPSLFQPIAFKSLPDSVKEQPQPQIFHKLLSIQKSKQSNPSLPGFIKAHADFVQANSIGQPSRGPSPSEQRHCQQGPTGVARPEPKVRFHCPVDDLPARRRPRIVSFAGS